MVLLGLSITVVLAAIGVAFDGSPESEAALAEATRLGQAAGAALRIFAVAESNIYFGYPPAPAPYDQAEVFSSMKEHLRPNLAYAARALISTDFASFSFGSGIVTSSTPSLHAASILSASTPVGSAIEREKDP
jgi:nucleotide-binding universal stress UspA family protein